MAKYTYNPPYNQWSGNRSDTLNKWKINYKGSIATASALPDKGEFKGDTYNVLEDGSNYMWNGTSWDKLDANIYIGATSIKDGIQGLVPPASNSQIYSLLTGGGTWESAEDLGLALDDEVVHLTGNETIEGVKLFAGGFSDRSTGIFVKSKDIVKGTPTGTTKYDYLGLLDSSGSDANEAGRLGALTYFSPASENSSYGIHIQVNEYVPAGEPQTVSMLEVGFDGEGNKYATAPATSDERTDSTDIVTRGYMEASEWNWQKSKKAGAVAFKPVPESDLEPVVDFMFTETLPAEGEKGPENPSTITGVSEVKLTRCGKNIALLPFVTSSYTQNGITITNNGDGSITINGTSTTNFYFIFRRNIFLHTGATLSINAEFSGITGDGVALQIASRDDLYPIIWQYLSHQRVVKTIPEDGYVTLRLYINKNVSLSNVVIKPQYEFGDAKTEYEAPILASEADYIIQLGDTYYGGSLDVATGVMTVTRKGVVLNSNFTCNDGVTIGIYKRYLVDASVNVIPPSTGISVDGIYSHGTYLVEYSSDSAHCYVSASGGRIYIFSTKQTKADLLAWFDAQALAGTPVTICYKLATPFTVQLTPTQIRSLPALDKYEPRINTVYTDQEAVQVGYQRYFDENRLTALEARIEALEAGQD